MKSIQWYPGHMARAKRLLAEAVTSVDVVCEILDARIPRSSRNPDVDRLLGAKPRVVVLNRADQADDAVTSRWEKHLSSIVIRTDAQRGSGCDRFVDAVRKAGRERLLHLAEVGRNDKLRAMIVGIPNVGKSSFINRLAGSRRAAAEDRPGVTRKNQWFYIEGGLELLDTPGILWPKFDDESGLNLAFTGAIRDEILDIEGLAAKLCEKLADSYLERLNERYRIDCAAVRETSDPMLFGGELLERIGRARGCLVSGGEVDFTRAANVVLDDFRSGKLGKITLEEPID